VRVSALWATSIIFLVLSGCASTESRMEKATNKAYSRIKKERQLKELAREEKKEEPWRTAEEYERSGDEYRKAGNYGMAFLKYGKALEMDPKNTALKNKIAGLYLTGGLLADALEAFEGLIKEEPAYAPAYEGLGRVYIATGDLEKAEENFLKAVERPQAVWESYNFLGIIADKKKDFEQAQGYYSKAIGRCGTGPGQAALYNNLGFSLYLSGKYEEAVKAYSEALKIAPDEKVYNNLGMALAKMGKYSIALESFKRSSPEHVAFNKLGIIYFNEGKYQEAAEAFKSAIEISPTWYANASENLEKTKEALLLKTRNN
jgi:tetratricopeptide (TPR) repeat protein